ncbi:MAG: hypothetical protein WAV05_08685 [Anaerolineales bacterium]
MAYLYYLLNGLLALLWLLVDHILLALLIAPLAWLSCTAPDEQRSWTLITSGLAVLASAVAPSPVPLLMLVMASSGWLATRLEQFNNAAACWNTVRGLALYSLAGLGFSAFQDLAARSDASPLLLQGQVYLSVIAAFAMYLIPLGYLALLAQTLLAHPPVPGKPAELIHTIRSRGKGS